MLIGGCKNEKIITKKDLELIINKLDNGIDKFILAGFFYGLNGSSSYKEQLLFLKVDDVDFKNKKINLPDGRVVIMDRLLEEVTKEAIEQNIYRKLGNTGSTNEDYLLNQNSKYIIKIKPTKSNNNGLDPLGVGGIKKRVLMISNYLGIEITPSILKISGAYDLLKSQGKKMKIVESEELLKTNGLSVRRNTLSILLKEINNEKLDNNKQ